MHSVEKWYRSSEGPWYVPMSSAEPRLPDRRAAYGPQIGECFGHSELAGRANSGPPRGPELAPTPSGGAPRHATD